MNIYKASVMEEAVDGLRGDGTDAERALEKVCARTQVLDGAKVFQRVAFFLKRIINGAHAEHGNGFSLHFKGLLHTGRGLDAAGNFDGRAHSDLLHHFRVIVDGAFLHDDLKIVKAAPVVHYDERKVFAFTGSAYPAFNGDAGNDIGRNVFE